MRTPLLLACATFGALPAHALYDPKPIPELSQCEGAWTGVLTYEDYQEPHRLVSLPTTLRAALDAPNEITLHFSFDDGPGKVVQAYERIALDLKAGVLVWSGLTPADAETCRILSSAGTAGKFEIVAETTTTQGGKVELVRYHFTLGGDTLQIAKEEGDSELTLEFRNRYLFHRPVR